MNRATTIACRGLAELNAQVIDLGDQGYRIITVIDSQNDCYTIVTQQDPFPDYKSLMLDLGNTIQSAVNAALPPL